MHVVAEGPDKYFGLCPLEQDASRGVGHLEALEAVQGVQGSPEDRCYTATVTTTKQHAPPRKAQRNSAIKISLCCRA